MDHQCKDCDRLQVKQSGTAPERPAFQQPTMYDHIANFQKFEQFKEEKAHLKQRQLELSTYNEKFTDFTPNPAKDDCHELSPQDIAEFRQELRQGDDNDKEQAEEEDDQSACAAATADTCTESKTTTEDDASDKLPVHKNKSLLVLTRTPVQCPISDCNRSIGVTSVLSHYLRDHHEDFGVQCREIFLGKSSTLVFDANSFDYRENVCLGVLAYGGRAEDDSTRPAERGISIHNAFLPKPHEKLDAHLPILIMACRTSWTALMTNNELENKITHRDKRIQELLVIWLASVQTTKPIHSTLTVYDKPMTASRSAIVRIRHLNDSQNPSEFLLEDTNFIRLSHGEINILSQDRKESIQMEIVINEYEYE